MNPEAPALIAHLESTAVALRRSDLERRWSRPALRAAVRSGRATRVLPGVYAATLHASSVHTRACAVASWRDATIIGQAACHLFDLIDPPRRLTIVARVGEHDPPVPWLVRRRIAVEIPHVTRPGNVPVRVATPAFAVVTAFAELEPAAGADLVYGAVQRGTVTAQQLAHALAMLPTVRGRRRLATLIAAVAAGSQSHLETHGLRRVFHTKEFARFVRQHEVVVEGRLARLDMYDPATRTAVELDGATHADPAQRERDIARDALLATQGILTLRFSWRQITREPHLTQDLVRRVFAARS